MKKTFNSTLIMAGVLVALVAWYLIYENRMKPDRVQAEEKTKQLLTLEDKDIQEVTVERLKNAPTEFEGADTKPLTGPIEYEKFQLKKVGQDWRLTSPIDDLADNSVVNSLVNGLTTAKQERIVDEKPTDLEPFGLKAPRIKISLLKDSKSTPQIVEIGKNTPVGFSAYAKISGKDPVYKIPRAMKSSSDKDLTALRNKAIFSIARQDVSEIEILNLKESFILKKGDKEEWTLARENIPADSNEVGKTLNAVVELKVKEFASEDGKDLAKYALLKPMVEIYLTNAKDKKRIGLFVGNLKDKLYVKREDRPNVYEVEREFLAKVVRPSSAYRSLQLANFNRFDVARVKLERGKELLELVKENGNWSVPADPATKLDSSKVDALLTAVQDTKIASYNPPGKHLEKDPPLVVRLFEKKDKTESEKVVLKFGKVKSKMVAAERGDLNLTFQLKEDDFKKINLSKKDLILEPPKPAAPTQSGAAPIFDQKAEDHKAPPKEVDKKAS